MIGEVNAIEDFMWNYNCETASFSAASLRNCCQFLSTLSGILRSESLYRGDLSDLCDFKFQQRNELYEYHIGIQRVSQSKVNKDKVMYGRTMRHRDVELCSIGALGLYLFTRFEVAKEIEHIDFSDNKSWFNRKLLRSMVHSGDGKGEYISFRIFPSI